MPEVNTAEAVCKDPAILQLSYGVEQANTYVLVSGNHAIVVDVCSKGVEEELKSRELMPDYVILTHEHVDHIKSLPMMAGAPAKRSPVPTKPARSPHPIKRPINGKSKRFVIIT